LLDWELAAPQIWGHIHETGATLIPGIKLALNSGLSRYS